MTIVDLLDRQSANLLASTPERSAIDRLKNVMPKLEADNSSALLVKSPPHHWQEQRGWSTLPAELLNAIMLNLDPSELPACARVCRFWAPVANEVLYAGPTPAGYDPRAYLRTLRNRPDYASMVKVNSWIFHDIDQGMGKRNLPHSGAEPPRPEDVDNHDLAFEITRCCPNLDKLHLYVTSGLAPHHSLRLKQLPMLAKVTQLHIHFAASHLGLASDFADGLDLSPVIPALTNLQAVRIDTPVGHIKSWLDPTPSSPDGVFRSFPKAFPQGLKRLELTPDVRLSKEDLQAILANSQDTLESLSFSPYHIPLDVVSASLGKAKRRLRNLTLWNSSRKLTDALNGNVQQSQMTYDEMFWSFLSELPRLESLALYRSSPTHYALSGLGSQLVATTLRQLFLVMDDARDLRRLHDQNWAMDAFPNLSKVEVRADVPVSSAATYTRPSTHLAFSRKGDHFVVSHVGNKYISTNEEEGQDDSGFQLYLSQDGKMDELKKQWFELYGTDLDEAEDGDWEPSSDMDSESELSFCSDEDYITDYEDEEELEEDDE